MKLDKLIDPSHLEPNTISRYQQQYAQSKPEHLILDNFFSQQALAIFNTMFSESQRFFLQQHTRKDKQANYYVSTDTWENTQEKERFVSRYEWAPPSSPTQALNSELGAHVLLKSLNSKEMIEFLCKVTQAPLSHTHFDKTSNPAKIFYCDNQNFIKQHSDSGEARQWCFLIYLTPDWQTDDGGQLCFKGNANHSNAIKSDGIKQNADNSIEITPFYNRCVLFNPKPSSALHWINAVHSDKRRYNITNWYFTKR